MILIVMYSVYNSDSNRYISTPFSVDYESKEKFAADLRKAAEDFSVGYEQAKADFNSWQAKAERMLQTGPRPEWPSALFEFCGGQFRIWDLMRANKNREDGSYVAPEILTLDEYVREIAIEKREAREW